LSAGSEGDSDSESESGAAKSGCGEVDACRTASQ
jgi:hypothetical protein